MTSSRDAEMIDLWLAAQAIPHTQSCYRRDVKRLIEVCRKPLADIGLGGLQRFARSLDGLAPVSRGRTLAAIRSLFGFGQRMRYLATNPAAELALPR
jgi:site-specific recombinase XerD